MNLENVDKNNNESNEVLKISRENMEDKEISLEELSSWLGGEERSFKEETQEELARMNSVGLDDKTFNDLKNKTEVESSLKGVDNLVEGVCDNARKESCLQDSVSNFEKSEISLESENWKFIANPVFNENYYYRIVNENGYKDFKDTGMVRSSPTGTESYMKGRFDLGHRNTDFPSFSKGLPALEYLAHGKKNFIFETNILMNRGGEENQITKKVISSRHWAYRPIDENGDVSKEIKKDQIKNIYMVDKDGSFFIKS